MHLELIKSYAVELIELLKPYCKRIEIAGSIRREKPDCKDVEIVCIADSYKLEKFFVENKHKYILQKNGGKYKRFKYKAVEVDLFICNENNWGLIYMLRTGSKDYNVRLIAALKNRGCRLIEGYMHGKDGRIYTPEEKTIFDFLQVDFIEPVKRNVTQKQAA